MVQSDEQVIYTILGACLCLGGWGFFWLGSRLLGVAVGMAFGFVFGDLLGMVLKLEPNASLLVLLACSLMGAFGGLLMMRVISTFAFGLAGFLFGALLGRMGAELYAHMNHQAFAFTAEIAVAIAAAGAVVAAMAVFMQKYIMIIITSYIGATFLVAGVDYLQTHEPWSTPLVVVAAIAWQIVLVTRLITDSPKLEAEEA